MKMCFVINNGAVYIWADEVRREGSKIRDVQLMQQGELVGTMNFGRVKLKIVHTSYNTKYYDVIEK